MNMTTRALPAALILGLVAACDTGAAGPDATQVTAQGYSPPEASGLRPVRPYPAPGSPCQVIGENDLTNTYLDDAMLLIGCPQHEAGAIRDMLDRGAVRVGQAGEWVLLNLPVR